MNFVPIRIGTLRPDDVINFDVFIRIAEKHIHYVRKSDPFDADRIGKLRSKGVKKLFIPEDSEQLYLDYLDRGLNQLQDTAVPAQEREALVRDSMITDAENVVRNVQTQAGYERTQNRMSKIVEFLTGDASVVKNVMSTAGVSQDNYQHSANVATLALGVAGLCGLTSPALLVEIGLAALLHDIGYTKLQFNARVPKEKMTVDQLAAYQQHPVYSASMLNDKPYVTKSVLELIADHEEIGDAIGFPNKKRLPSLSLSQQVLNLCNDYDRFALMQKKTHREVAKEYFQTRIGCFDLNHIKFLMTVFK